MKNVLLLINQLHTGGAQKVVSRLSVELSKKHNVFIVTYNNTESMFDHAGEHIFIKLPYSENPSQNNALARFLRFAILIFRVRKIKRKKKIHTSISFLEASNIVNVLSKGREKVILSVRSHLSSELKDDKRLNVFKHMIKRLYNRAFRVVVPAELMSSDLSENFDVEMKKIEVIYNFIDQEQIKTLANEPVSTELEAIMLNSPVLINVGRITNPKAQWFLVPILSKIKQSVPHAKLVLLGDGPLKAELIALARQHQFLVYDASIAGSLNDKYDILLLGFKENPFPYLHRSDVMVSTSIYEGFPNAMIEAMASGLPVVSSDCPSGPREILAPGTDLKEMAKFVEYGRYGVLLPVISGTNGQADASIEAWAATIVELLQNDTKRKAYAEKSVQRSDDFNKKTILDKWNNLIDM